MLLSTRAGFVHSSQLCVRRRFPRGVVALDPTVRDNGDQLATFPIDDVQGAEWYYAFR
jgi:hypothetical protein